MFAVTGLHGANDLDSGNIGATEGAIMGDIFHARAAIGDDLGETREATRTITNSRAESREATIIHESAFNDSTEHRRIDISSTNSQRHILAREFWELARHHGCEWRGGGAFNHRFFQLNHP